MGCASRSKPHALTAKRPTAWSGQGTAGIAWSYARLAPAQASARVTPKVLVVFLHGDNGGRTELKADSGAAAMLAEKTQAVTVAMQRPGYRSDLGTSDGPVRPRR